MKTLSETEIRRYLAPDLRLCFDIFDTIDSTNTYLKNKAENSATEGSVALAGAQSAGKGRMGRSFLSPDGSGIYLSMLLRPTAPACNGVLITACAAVAVSEAIENVTGIKVGIKWVNDLYHNEKKVCGILAESSIDVNTSSLSYVVLGIGVNLLDTFKGTEIENIATGLFTSLTKDEITVLRHRLIAEIINIFFAYYKKGLSSCKNELLEKYRSRLFIIEETVDVISYTDIKQATVVSLNDDFTLKVKYCDGSTKSLNSGEVRLKLK